MRIVSLPGFGLAGALEGRRRQLARQRENTSRSASLTVEFDTDGSGQSLGEPFSFGLTFLERPSMTFGVALAEGVSLDIETQVFPRATCGVASWTTDRRGCYLGAQLFFCCDVGAGVPATTARAAADAEAAAVLLAGVGPPSADPAYYGKYWARRVDLDRLQVAVDREEGEDFSLTYFVTFLGIAIKYDPAATS